MHDSLGSQLECLGFMSAQSETATQAIPAGDAAPETESKDQVAPRPAPARKESRKIKRVRPEATPPAAAARQETAAPAKNAKKPRRQPKKRLSNWEASVRPEKRRAGKPGATRRPKQQKVPFRTEWRRGAVRVSLPAGTRHATHEERPCILAHLPTGKSAAIQLRVFGKIDSIDQSRKCVVTGKLLISKVWGAEGESAFMELELASRQPEPTHELLIHRTAPSEPSRGCVYRNDLLSGGQIEIIDLVRAKEKRRKA